jgi:oligopeptide transport system ATP-binding protein
MNDRQLLDVRNLKVRFHTGDGVISAVDGVSFQVDAGETLVVVGESGSGKSVTSLAIMGLVPNPPGIITGGSVIFRGKDGREKDLVKLSQAELRHILGNDMAMLFQVPLCSLSPV